MVGECTLLLEHQCPDGGRMGLPLLTLLLVIHTCPERMANGLSSPFYQRLSQAGGALPAPMDPRFVPASFRHRRDTRILLAFIRGGVAFPLFTARDEEARGTDGASTWQGGK